jgi:hypothetical protein
MSPLDTLPPPETIADQLASARRERSLLRRLYQLSVEVRNVRDGRPESNAKSGTDKRQGGDHE